MLGIIDNNLSRDDPDSTVHTKKVRSNLSGIIGMSPESNKDGGCVCVAVAAASPRNQSVLSVGWGSAVPLEQKMRNLFWLPFFFLFSYSVILFGPAFLSLTDENLYNVQELEMRSGSPGPYVARRPSMSAHHFLLYTNRYSTCIYVYVWAI